MDKQDRPKTRRKKKEEIETVIAATTTENDSASSLSGEENGTLENENEIIKLESSEISPELSLLTEIPVVNTEDEKDEKNDKIDNTDNDLEQKKKSKIEEPKKEIKRYLDTPILEGLSSEIVKQRIEEGLTNKSSDDKGKTVIQIILSNLFTFFNMLYLVITIIFIVLGSFENLLFLVTIIPNLIIGIIQEIKAKRMIDKLKLMSAPTATVIRDGQKIEIPTSEVVLDDILLFTPGKQICSDAIVVDGFAEVNEALLTGEADAIVKNVGDQLYSGSYVVSGVVVARADKVGKDNYIEKLSKNAKVYLKPKSELLRTLNTIIKFVSVIILPLAIATYISSSLDAPIDYLGIFNRDGLIRAASSILAMIPAGLFLLTSIALFVGVIRLGKYKTLVQELYCIEMLARVNVLCLDKTGTITDGTMRVTDCIELKNPTDFTIREIIGSMMNAFDDVNPTSEALIKYFDKNNVLTPTDKIPFSSKRKYSAVTFGEHGTFVLGAPEFILKDHFDKVAARVERFTLDGARVLILGHTNTKFKADELPKNIKPICIIALQDHIREEAIETIEFFKQNGVDIKVISGDNPVTVSKIAQRAGIEGAERYISLAGLTDDEVRESVFEYNVFGRVSPEQKRILVKELKEHKKTVAMTGDGVNDILALKEADCSIAMASGSEATRYVSHLVLMDSNFSSMPRVVQEGRRVINNIQKTSTLFLVKTIFSILLAILYIILGLCNGKIKMSYPFAARNLYMIEWFAIGIPAAFLALQPNRELVKGKFLSNVLKSTLPGALTIVILHILLSFIRTIPGLEEFYNNKHIYTTIATIVTTYVMMVVLFKVCKPFNLLRRFIYVTMVILCVLAASNLIPFMKLDISYRKTADQYNYETEVIRGEWVLNGRSTSIKAFKMPELEIISTEYVTPILTVSKNEKWVINGYETTVIVRENEKIKLEVIDGYWYLNNNKTKAKATKMPKVIIETNDYSVPQIGIIKDTWALDGISTNIKVSKVKELRLNVNYLQNWTINSIDTSIKARFKVINENEYLIPEITIETINNERYFAINGKITTIKALDADNINLEVIDNYWYLNGLNTYEVAKRIKDSVGGTSQYVRPVIEISRYGRWVVNGNETIIKAEDNVLIVEVLITIMLILVVDPLMRAISYILKKFRLSNNE